MILHSIQKKPFHRPIFSSFTVVSRKMLYFHWPSLSHNYSLCQEPEALNCFSRSLGYVAFQVFHGSPNGPRLSGKKKMLSLEKTEPSLCLWLVSITHSLLQKADGKDSSRICLFVLGTASRGAWSWALVFTKLVFLGGTTVIQVLSPMILLMLSHRNEDSHFQRASFPE